MHSGKDSAIRGVRGGQRAGPLGGGSMVERNLNRWTIFAILFFANTILLLKP
jgi:preprotein translocase subunit SecG